MTERSDSRATDEEREETGAEGENEPDRDDGTRHLDDVEDGVGCTEIWERLSEQRES